MLAKNKREEEVKFPKEVYGANFETQSHKKLWNYFLEVVKKESFKSQISALREKYEIPKKGFEAYDANPDIPELWMKNYVAHLPTHKKKQQLAVKRMWKALGRIAREYQLRTPEWKHTLMYYLFYNKLEPMLGYNMYNLCFLSDLNTEAKRRWQSQGRKYKEKHKLKKIYYRSFPIAIKISPYASERDIIDYVKKMSQLIKKYQKPYINPNVKIGKVRKKKPAIQERNDFIYENRHLSLNETKARVEAKFEEVLDYEYIGKIRSEEAKRRQEV